MKKLMLGSLFMKGLGAVVEIIIQIIIIKFLQVEGYGEYGYYISVADIGFWLLFSAITKCNVFYLSGSGALIKTFSKKYYIFYVCPVILAATAVICFLNNPLLFFSSAILLLEILVYDKSSRMLANFQYKASVFGEYCFGRLVLLVCILLLGVFNKFSMPALLTAYVVQYAAVYVFFIFTSKKAAYTVCQPVSINKVLTYQYGDALTGLIRKAPVILQYLFVGAFETGFINVIALVRTLISFISGPTSKVFLPEFSRLYKERDKEKTAVIFRSVIVLQMLFLVVIGVCLVGFPNVIIGIFSKSLLCYSDALAGISVCFLIGCSFGPCSGLMQMTGREKTDISIRTASVLVMIIIWILTRNNRLFVLFGIGAQAVCENVADYVSICVYLKKMPVGVPRYLLLWLPFAAAIAAVKLSGLTQSFAAMVTAAVLTALLYAAIQLCDRELRGELREYIKKFRKRGQDK